MCVDDMEKLCAVSGEGLIKLCFLPEWNMHWSETVKVNREEKRACESSCFTSIIFLPNSHRFLFVHVKTQAVATSRFLKVPSKKHERNIFFSCYFSWNHSFAFLHTWRIQYAKKRMWYFIDFQKFSTWHLCLLEINPASLFLLFGDRGEKWECSQR